MPRAHQLFAASLRLSHRWRVVPALAVAGLLAPLSSALASVCYQLPFPNPDLADGWGSLCCGRTSPHRGVDFPQASGTAVPAVAAGVVVINTWSNCLGNVVVVQHADGMFSSYNHLVVASPLGIGAEVALGTQVGQVGNTGTCSFGAHLHLNMSDHADGYGSGSSIDPYAYILSHTTCNEPPSGSLQAADCEAIVGWAQDPDTDAPIATHLYFDGPAGDPAATSVAVTADLVRADLCAMGWCYHTFRVPTPLRLQDGAAHPVHAYAIDDGGDNNPELESSPRTLDCAPPLTGMRRRIADDTVLAAWQFSTVDDMLTIDDDTLTGLAQTMDLPPAPVLVRADDGEPDVWLVDGAGGERRRRVPDLHAAAAWHLDLSAAAVWPAAQLAALDEAPALRPRPVVVKGSGPEMFVLDDPLEPLIGPPQQGGDSDSDSDSGYATTDSPTTTGDDSTAGVETDAPSGSGDSTAGAGGDEAGCGCRGSDRPEGWLGAAVLVLLGVGRRRRSA